MATAQDNVIALLAKAQGLKTANADLQAKLDAAIAAANSGLLPRKAGAQADAKREPGKGMPWQTAKKLAENHCARNRFPGVNALARLVGCSPATMSKAIGRSAKLRARRAEHDAQRTSVSAGAMTGEAASAKQTREPNPIDAASASTDDLFRRLLEEAQPSERAKLNALTPAQRRELVATIEHDPDKPRTVRRPFANVRGEKTA